jgi:hypothetical protein
MLMAVAQATVPPNSAVLADIWDAKTRGTAMVRICIVFKKEWLTCYQAIYTLAPFAGPARACHVLL